MRACGKRPSLLMYFFIEERLFRFDFRTSFTLVNCASFIILGANEKCFLMNNISRVPTTVVSFRHFAIKITAIFLDAIFNRKWKPSQNGSSHVWKIIYRLYTCYAYSFETFCKIP